MTFQSDIWLLLWIGIVALVAYTSKLKRKVTVLGQKTEQYSLAFAIIAFLPVFLFVSIGEIRSDGWAYYGSFIKLSSSVSDVFQNWWSIKGPGYTLIEVLIKDVFDYVMSVFLFIAMGYYSGWMMNGIRQFVAACIIFAATPLLIKRKIIPTLLIILLAMTVHVSAMMMLPIVLVIWFEPWKKGIIVSYVVFVIALFIFVNNTDMLSEEIKSVDNGANVLRIFISAIPCVIAFIGRKKIAADNNPLINICINMSVFTTLIFFVATFTNGIGTGRLPMYTALYNLILIPYLCKSVFNETVSKNIKIFFILFYIAYFFADLYFV